MPGEAQRNRAPHPLTVAQVIEQLRTMPPDDICCVSAPGGPDRCVTGVVATRGHTRLTTMPGWLPGTGTATAFPASVESGEDDDPSGFYDAEETEILHRRVFGSTGTNQRREGVSEASETAPPPLPHSSQSQHEKLADDIRDSLDRHGSAY